MPAVATTQTEQVVLVDMESFYGQADKDTESMGRDLIRLVRQYFSQHPAAFGKLAGHNPVPEYTFNQFPYAIPAPRSDWPEPPLPMGVDWDAGDHGVREYEERVMMFHLVNAAHSIVRLRDPTLHSDPNGDPVKLVRLRDISIGLRDNKSSRIIIECMGPPGTLHVSEGYHPQWDVDSDDDFEQYDGKTRVEKERNFLNDLVDRAARRRDHCRSLAARLANLHVRDYHHLTAAEKRIRDNKLTHQELTQFLCWEDLAILACDNRERLSAAETERVALTSSLQTTQALLEDERGAHLIWETRKKDLLLEMEELQVNVTVAQRREADLEAALSALRDRYAAAESQWKFEREAAQRELDQAARREHELRYELVMALEAHQPPTVGWRVELDNTRQELETTKRELLAARRVIDSLRAGESHHAPGLREESMGTAGRGFPVFTPSPASSAASRSMSTADFGSASCTPRIG